MRCLIAVALVGAVMLGALPALAADGEGRISGHLLEIRPDGSLVIEEQGPWIGPNTGIIRRTVALGPDTTIRVVRSKQTWGQGDREPGYAVTPSDFRELKPGDFVTVTTGGASKAVAIDVVRPGGADVGQASPAAEPATK
jgi:hypothetical protein